jgi:hypothetical protein
MLGLIRSPGGDMTSERQKTANRRNAQKSTGPRTMAGKAAVRINALQHGLLSREVLVAGESKAELVDFGKGLRAELAPVGAMELLLADRIVAAAWRLRRLLRVEVLLLKEDGAKLEQAFSSYGREKMALLSRYEASIERGLYKALHELQRLQAARRGEPVPVPEAVDVAVSISAPDPEDERLCFAETSHWPAANQTALAAAEKAAPARA